MSVARPWVQAAFVLFILFASVRHHISAEHAPSIHAYCPFGVIASIWPLATTGTFVQKVHASSAVLGAAVILSAFVVGGAFCGWVCPLGSLGDALEWVRRKLHLRSLRVPTGLDRALRYGRYLTLFGIIYATAVSAKLWFGSYDPYSTIFGLEWLFEPSWSEHWRAYVVALGIVVGSLFVRRLWCRYLCPLGGLVSLIQRVSFIKIRRNAGACIDCGRCDSDCPMVLDVSTRGAVTHDCVMCLRCTERCPVPGALETATPGYETLDLSEETSA